MVGTPAVPPMRKPVSARLTRALVPGRGSEPTATRRPLPPSPALGELAGSVAGVLLRVWTAPAERQEDGAAGLLRSRGEVADVAGQPEASALVERQALEAAVPWADPVQAGGLGAVSAAVAAAVAEAGTVKARGVETERDMAATITGMGTEPSAEGLATVGRYWIG